MGTCSGSSSNYTKYLKFYGWKVECTRNRNFGDYPGDIRLYSGDQEIRSKIWSLPDYPGELTALWMWGWGWPCFDTNLFPLLLEIMLKECQFAKKINLIFIIKQDGLYQNKVNSSLISTCNCKMLYLRILWYFSKWPSWLYIMLITIPSLVHLDFYAFRKKIHFKKSHLHLWMQPKFQH